MARVTAMVGHNRSSMSVFTESSISPHAPLDRPNLTRLRVLLRANLLADTFKLLRNPLICGSNFIERVSYLARQTVLIAGHPNRKIPHAHGLQGTQQVVFE
jgi:hypothetical protein